MSRKPFGVSFETWIDKQIREATERGEMDNLPGAGKPLPGAGRPHDEQWWIKNYLKREGLTAESMLPTPLQLRKEIERLPETVAQLASERDVREVVADLNRRIVEWLRAPSGPLIRVARVDVDAVVEQWRADRPVPPEPPARPEPVRKKARWWRRL
ncbi:hypothetical protein JOF56_010262 [Kibdelosporangium banguiense]|uniref:DnaJ homologue subfamily C member 28 conserved domain-containing protein n=1 Tax=Kibdelosporangium banguiense TaxID=1365924 RepID=A0ABS4TZP3_9PSEU|nr:DUF1992 domain-containing protein [Kibdelosporangium banguiense]MBP2329877.1 hypothetical protein [Kibdelosporangium banguiense]